MIFTYKYFSYVKNVILEVFGSLISLTSASKEL